MIVLDTSAVLTMSDPKDASHALAVEFAQEHVGGLILPSATLGELAHLLPRIRHGAEVELLEACRAGELLVDWQADEDLARSIDILARLPGVGVVDALVASCALRRDLPVLSFDRRDFVPLAGTFGVRLLP